MDSSQVPHVIVRYDNEQSRQNFEAIFGKDFVITPARINLETSS